MAGKPKNARYTAVIPVLNNGCSIPTSVPLPLSDNVAFQKIRGDELAVITEKDSEAFGVLKGGSYTLSFNKIDSATTEHDIQTHIAAAAFSLNVLSTGTPVSFGKAYFVRTLRKVTLHNSSDITGHRHSNLTKFEIPKGTDLSYASNLFESLMIALNKHPPLRITISRYSSAIGRTANDDKLIDLCIALESIFQAQTEISFQFALYNSILSEEEAGKRYTIFKTLKKLYSHRSRVVHGTKDLDEDWLLQSWPDLIRIAKASILRKIDFLNANNHDDWRDHLEGLALGIEDDD